MSTRDLTLQPLPPSDVQRRLAMAEQSAVLLDLPFFSTMPDTGKSHRFIDNRKSQFLHQVYGREAFVGDREPPAARLLAESYATKPARDFGFEASRRPRGDGEVSLVVRRRESNSVVPFQAGRGVLGAHPGDSAIFPRFAFNDGPSALSSKAYGLGQKGHGEHAPLKRRPKRLEEQAAGTKPVNPYDAVVDQRVAELNAALEESRQEKARDEARRLNRRSGSQVRRLL